jgi:hypothetical protein
VAAHDEGPAVSRATRRLVHLFLLVFAVTGVAHLELFPFSGFRLFAELRGDERHSWQLRAVVDGDEVPILLGELPLGYRNTSTRLRTFDELDTRERDAICDDWAQPLRAGGTTVEAVRVYAVVQHVHPGGPPPERRLAYECGTPR